MKEEPKAKEPQNLRMLHEVLDRFADKRVTSTAEKIAERCPTAATDTNRPVR
jgi:hypothetical protein